MTDTATIVHAANALSALLPDAKLDPEVMRIIGAEQSVRTKFAPIFALEQVQSITEVEFRSFLPIGGNGHWTGLTRLGYQACDDMGKLRDGLAILVDETRPLADRYDQTLQMVFGMGKGLATGILMVAHNNRYGVWNGVSEAALQRLSVFPSHRGTEGNRYSVINEVLHYLADAINLNLWQLDAILWWVVNKTPRHWTVSEMAPDMDEEIAFPEGAVQYRMHKTRERHPELVKQAKERALAVNGKLTCECCSFDFGQIYGKAGVGYIEVHHNVPVSQLQAGASTKLSDLTLLCSNCHRIIHRRRPWLTVEQLRTILQAK